jgi:hypothetical protein
VRWVAAVGLAGTLLTALAGRAPGGPALASAPSAGVAPSPHTPARSVPLPQAVDTVFRHADHREYACTRCHGDDREHGSLLIRSVADCRSCHHALPVATTCTGCHRDDVGSDRLLEVMRTLTLPRGASAARALPFRHALHQAVACSTCHGSPPAVAVQPVDCAGCHADHHTESADCSACHVEAPAAVHPLAVHEGCAGAGCHEDAPLETVPRARAACLVCHREQAEHRRSQECADCHVMPPAPVEAAALTTRGGRR